MKKYRYVEFTDGVWSSPLKTGKLFIVVEKEKLNEYIEEFSLIQYGGGYYTTLEQIGNLGWELAFVTPCGSLRENGGQMIQNAYVFKKESED
jgi:hypothetical protein